MNSLTSETVSSRRERLRQWIETNHKGSQTAFARITGIHQAEISRLLRDKSFGEKRAAAIERLAGMPEGYLVNPLTPDELVAPAGNSLAKDEAELLRRYRAASAEARRILLAAARATIQQKGGKAA